MIKLKKAGDRYTWTAPNGAKYEFRRSVANRARWVYQRIGDFVSSLPFPSLDAAKAELAGYFVEENNLS